MCYLELYYLIFAAAAAAKSLKSCPTLCDPVDGSPPGSSVPGNSPAKNTGGGCHALLQGIFPIQGSNPAIESRSPALQADSLPFEPPGKPPTPPPKIYGTLHQFVCQYLKRYLS